jgi:RNA polymerase sigma-B factor
VSTSTIDHGPLNTSAEVSCDERGRLTEELLVRAAYSVGPDRKAALDEVVELHIGLAHRLASRYYRRGIADEDLQQVACLALIKAVRGYDPAKATTFVAYAIPTIRGELRRHFRDSGWVVRPPRRLQELDARIRAVQSELSHRLGRAPTWEEIAEAVGVDPQTAREAEQITSCYRPASFDAVSSPVGHLTLADRLADDDEGYSAAEARVLLEPLLRGLSDRERLIIDLRFVAGLTQQEIGDRLGISQMQISRILASVYVRLRTALGAASPAA